MISDEIAVTNKKDGFYANPSFLLQFFVYFYIVFEFLFIFTFGQKCFILELSFSFFPGLAGFKLKQIVY